jgi:alanyl-tRNA synthetase
MHKALREVLGEHVRQKGSQVDPDKTRFDFVHGQPMSDEEIRRVESLVNAEILANTDCLHRAMPIGEAQKLGAVMLFGEKYGDVVRVIDIGASRELCGGTHVGRTGDIGVFSIVAESGVAAGIRRVEAITGEVALSYLQGMETALGGVAGTLKVQPGEVPARVHSILDEVHKLERELTRLKSKQVAAQGDALVDRVIAVKDAKVLAATLDGADVNALRATVDKLRDRLGSAAVVLATAQGSKVTLIAGVTADLTGKLKAGELVNFVARQVGGKGGGRPDMAQAGGTEPDKLLAALASVRDWVEARL